MKDFIVNFIKSLDIQDSIEINLSPNFHYPIKSNKGKCFQCKLLKKDSYTVYKCYYCKIFLYAKCFEDFHISDSFGSLFNSKKK